MTSAFTLRLTATALLVAAPAAQGTYYPQPDAQGGWRSLVTANVEPNATDKQTIRDTVSMDWDVLRTAWTQVQPHGGGFLVIRDGWIVGEWGQQGRLPIASCTKTLTSLLMQRLYDQSDAGQTPKSIAESDPAADFLPASWSSGQPEKLNITLRHLTTMSSGLEPDDAPTTTQAWKDRILSIPVESPPDEDWVYASAPVDLLSLVVEDVTGQLFEDSFEAEIGNRIGMGQINWGRMGSSTVASAYAQIAPRDMARLAYMMLQDGVWDDGSGPETIVSSARLAGIMEPFAPIRASEYIVPNNFTNDPHSHLRYGRLLWNTNLRTDFVSSEVSSDGFYMSGFGTVFCHVVPMYDLIVVRLGSFPRPWDDSLFTGVMDAVMASVMDRETHAGVELSDGGCLDFPLLYAEAPVLGTGRLFLELPTVDPMIPEVGILYGFPTATPTEILGCMVDIQQPMLGTAVLPPGQTGLDLPLPNSPGLAGIIVAFQCYTASQAGLGLSNAVDVTLGY